MELRLGIHRVAQLSDELHSDEPITVGMRGVLEFLLLNSDSTVPTIARSRHVTRQHIQALVNPLLEQKLVELQSNPAHRRSPLLTLTRKGEEMIRRMRKREKRFFEAMSDDVSEQQITAAAQTLRAVRAQLKQVEA